MLPGGEGFRNFIADMGPRSEGKSLDRIDVQGHYEPTNCRWADDETQANNMRKCIFKNCKPPSVESIRAMERRIEAEFEEHHPY